MAARAKARRRGRGYLGGCGLGRRILLGEVFFLQMAPTHTLFFSSSAVTSPHLPFSSSSSSSSRVFGQGSHFRMVFFSLRSSPRSDLAFCLSERDVLALIHAAHFASGHARALRLFDAGRW